MFRLSAFFPQFICGTNRIAQRIYFVFAFPYPIGHLGIIICPMITVCRLIKSVCVWVYQYILNLTFYQLCDYAYYFGIFVGKCKIRFQLARRIPKPHGRNVASNNIHPPIIGMMNRFFQCIGKPATEQCGYIPIFFKM